jgi:dephospho-CoA kinase
MDPIIIGLTGGVASGKSTALKVMKKLGAKTIDADVLARKVVAPGTPALAKIKKRFGDVLFKNGRLDRKKLASVVFRDKKALADLNAIVHPEVFAMERKLVAEYTSKKKRAVIVVDAPVMIESGSHIGKHALIVMDSSEENQINRLGTQRGFTRAQSLARIKSQMPLKEKLKHADYVIKNNGTVADLQRNTREVYATALKYFSNKR